ncbi:SIMPL domain-containing protein [Microbulbifer sp. TYP-18]|uniref:SIMPL domain-containing protein n=1 Tax=Microbulbifer sp. TYP-18 TaxID=3230024 RepID=UPI0034C6BBFD
MKLVAGTLLAGLVVLATGCGSRGGEAEGTLVNISAQGEVSKAPDVAEISAGVTTEGKDSKAVMQANAEQMDKLVKAVEKAGIEQKDVQTSGISLSPRYGPVTSSSGVKRPQITGYMARNTVQIKVRKIEDLGGILDVLTEAGATNIHGPSFSIGEPEPLMAEARKQAVEKARARAQSFAEALGMKVGRIVSISEGAGRGIPLPMMRAEMASADARVPIALGETKVTVDLDLVFELRD